VKNVRLSPYTWQRPVSLFCMEYHWTHSASNTTSRQSSEPCKGGLWRKDDIT